MALSMQETLEAQLAIQMVTVMMDPSASKLVQSDNASGLTLPLMMETIRSRLDNRRTSILETTITTLILLGVVLSLEELAVSLASAKLLIVVKVKVGAKLVLDSNNQPLKLKLLSLSTILIPMMLKSLMVSIFL